MNVRRRTVLAAGASLAVAGCVGTSAAEPTVSLHNEDTEPHYVRLRVAGTENDEPVFAHTTYLEPGERESAPEPIDMEAVEGDLYAYVKIDHREERRYTEVRGGYVHLGVWIREDLSVSFSQGVA